MNRSRGMTLIEVSVAGVLLAVLITVSLQLMGATAARRRAVEDRQTAGVEASNVMERLAALPWEELTPENVAAVRLSSEARKTLCEGRLEIDVARPGDEPLLDQKRITVSVGWQDRSGAPQRPVRLVSWRYRTDGGKGPSRKP